MSVSIDDFIHEDAEEVCGECVALANSLLERDELGFSAARFERGELRDAVIHEVEVLAHESVLAAVVGFVAEDVVDEPAQRHAEGVLDVDAHERLSSLVLLAHVVDDDVAAVF